MEIIRYTSPFEYENLLALIEETFGKSEAMLELPQMNGAETDFNTDWIYVAKEGDSILGTVHATIPKAHPELCGVSGVCTTPAAQGKGVAKKLFAQMMDDIDNAGVKVSLLGTGNMIAAKLYSSFGFAYLSCSGVMVRLKDCDIVDFTQKTFSEKPEEFHIVDGSPDFRIAMIPLALLAGQSLLDINTNLYGRGFFSQNCCMSLFQRYLTLQQNGGRYFGAISEKGVLGAMASVIATERGLRADVFTAGKFADAAQLLLEKCEQSCGEVYLQLTESDKGKRALAENLGYCPVENVMISYGSCMISTTIYRKG